MSDFSFKTHPKTLTDLFWKWRFSVPKYQRQYSWSFDNIEDLWVDITSEEGHFVGVIVLKSIGESNFEIIDGQQRLITITIMLSAIRNFFILSGNNEKAKTVQKLIVTPNFDNEDDSVVVSPGKSLDNFLGSYIQEFNEINHGILMTDDSIIKSDEIKKVVKNYRLISTKLNSLLDKDDPNKSLIDIFEKVKKVQILALTVKNDDDAFALFETLNYKLAKLSEIDLIKNRLFMALDSVQSQRATEDAWVNLVKNVSSDKESADEVKSFFQYYWWSRNEKVSMKLIFKELRSKRIIEEFKLMRSDSEVYNSIINNGRDLKSWDLEELIKVSNLIPRLKQIYVPVLALARVQARDNYRIKYKTSYIKVLTEYLCRFVIAYKYSDKSPAILERAYSKYAILITNAKDGSNLENIIKGFLDDLQSNLPSEEEFLDNFDLKYIPKNHKNNALIAYLFEKISFKNRELSYSETNLEHIFPQKPAGEVLSEDRKILSVVHELGNLSPLGNEINISADNLRPRQKLQYYNESEVPMIKDIYNIIENYGWTKNNVLGRTKDLKSAIWKHLSKPPKK